MLVLEGVIKDVIFRNDSNGYTVAVLETDDGEITIVGNAAIINIDELVKVEGNLIYHNDYGEQFAFDSIATTTPSTLKGIENYLASGLLPYIGPKTARNIVDKFGEDSLDIIQNKPEQLLKIPGIGKKKLERISDAYKEHREMQDIMVYLQQFDITTNLAIKIYKKYGNETIRIISENPYRLSEDIYGIGFKKADEIARNMGIAEDSPFRIEAGLKYVLFQSRNDGHCYLPMKELIKKTYNLLNIELELIEKSLRELEINQDFYFIKTEDEVNVYSMDIYLAEMETARKLVNLSRVKLKQFDVDLDSIIEEIEREEDITFGNKQKEAIKESVKHGTTIITGGPGTGKTTTINAIIRIFEELELKVQLAAPTGRAAKRMTETSGRESQTIHRLLEFAYMEEGAMFTKDEDEPLDAEVIIIDEASMIDIILMNNLLKAIDVGTRLILVGDIDQLPSVGPGNVLKDIISSGRVNTVELDEIFRQAEESMIVVNAHRINKGLYPYLNEKDKDFFFLNTNNQDETLDTIIDLVRNRLPNYYKLDPMVDIQVLTPMRKGKVGTRELNTSLQKALNPKGLKSGEKKVGNTIYRVGDKVMQIKNNYNAEWEVKSNGFTIDSGTGIFNGDFGYILEIDEVSKLLTVKFDDNKEVEYDFKDLDELHLAYATTVHKAQGSEFPVVVMPIEWGPPMLLMRNLIYTAITRASELVVLVGNQRYLKAMIDNNRIDTRYSSLDERINDLYKYLEPKEEKE